MSKHKKRGKEERGKDIRPAAAGGQPLVAHAPTRRRTLLAVSILLFVLWFIFLLVTALSSSG